MLFPNKEHIFENVNIIYMKTDFEKYAISRGISSNTLDSYRKATNSMVNPMILEEREMNVIGLDVFSRLMYDRILFLGTEVNEDSANIINSQLMYLNSIGDDDVKLFINSPGGSVTDGLAIYDVMNFITPDVSTYCMGKCASMGAVLLSSGTKGKRYSLPHGDIMIHQVSGGTGRAQCSDIQIVAEEIKKTQDTLYRILSENTGKTIEQIAKDADRDCWFTAEEAKEYGLIDEIIKKSK